MAQYYIHRVGHQEMGSVNSREDTPSRGRYFLSGKRKLGSNSVKKYAKCLNVNIAFIQ